jgi:hypothetical protein
MKEIKLQPVSLMRWSELCLASDNSGWTCQEICQSFNSFFGTNKPAKSFGRAYSILQKSYKRAPPSVIERFATDPELHKTFPNGPPRAAKIDRLRDGCNRTRFELTMLNWRLIIMRQQLIDFEKRYGKSIQKPDIKC